MEEKKAPTPGPWELDTRLPRKGYKSPRFQVTWGNEDRWGCAEIEGLNAEANARLIAAAPALLAALKRAKEDLMNLQEDVNSGEFELDHQFAIDRVEAALKEVQ